MKIRFDGTLDYQLDAIESITSIFKTQKLNRTNVILVPEDGVIKNTLDIKDDSINLEVLNFV